MGAEGSEWEAGKQEGKQMFRHSPSLHFFRTNVLEQSQVVFPFRDVQRNISRQASHTGAGDGTEQVTDWQGPTSKSSKAQGGASSNGRHHLRQDRTGETTSQGYPTFAIHSWWPGGHGAPVSWHRVKMQILIQRPAVGLRICESLHC